MVEMAVVIGLLGLVLTVVVQSVIAFQDAAAGADSRQENLEEARIAMAVLTKDLRTATSFSALAADDVTFLGLLNTGANAPANRIRLSVDAQGELREAITPPARSPTPGRRSPGRSAGVWSTPGTCSASATRPTTRPPPPRRWSAWS
jgi:type II secretory pathway pseudopilin PulG